MHRRTALKGLTGSIAGVAGLGVLSACSSGGSGNGSGQATVQMSWWGDTTRNKAINDSLDLFEKANPTVKVERDVSGKFPDYNQKVAAQAAAGDAGDIITTGTESLTTYADLLIDLNEHKDTLDLSGFTDADLALDTIGGKLIGLPASFTISGVTVNKTIFEKAKVDLPDPAKWSWDEMLTLAQELTKASPDKTYGIGCFGFGQLYFMFNIGYQNGEKPYGDDGKLTLSHDTISEYFALVKKATDMGASPPADVAIEAAQNASTTDLQYAMNMGNAGGIAGALTKLDPGTQLEIVQSPGADPKSTYYTAGISWGITKQGKDVDDAVKVLNFLLTNQEAVNVRGIALQIPLNSKVIDGVKAQLDKQTAAAMDWAMKAKATGTELASPKSAWGSFANVQAQATTDLLQGRATAAQAATQFADGMNRLVEQSS